MRPQFANFLRDSSYCLNELDQLPPNNTTLLKYSNLFLEPENETYNNYLQDILFLCASIKSLETNKIFFRIGNLFSDEVGTGLMSAKRVLLVYCEQRHPDALYDSLNYSYFTQLERFTKTNYSDHLLILEKLKNFPQELHKPDHLMYNEIWGDINEFIINPSDLFWLKGDMERYTKEMQRRNLIINLVEFMRDNNEASILEIQHALPTIIQALSKHFD